MIRINKIDIENIEQIIEYRRRAVLTADEPLNDLLMVEVEYMLDKIIPKNRNYDKFIKKLIELHCLGYGDTDISKGIEMITGRKISSATIRSIRIRILDRIVRTFKTQIGLITLLYETFKEIPVGVEYDIYVKMNEKHD